MQNKGIMNTSLSVEESQKRTGKGNKHYLIGERMGKWEGEGEGEKHRYVVASCVPTTGDLAHNPGMCPDWELNQRPFGL